MSQKNSSTTTFQSGKSIAVLSEYGRKVIKFDYAQNLYRCAGCGRTMRRDGIAITCDGSCASVDASRTDAWAQSLRWEYWISETNRAVSAHLLAKFNASLKFEAALAQMAASKKRSRFASFVRFAFGSTFTFALVIIAAATFIS